MNKKIKTVFLLLMTITVTSGIKAQSLEEGKKLFFYQRYASAKNELSQVLKSDASNIDAIYWLGQTEIALGDTTGAKALYQKASLANAGNPLLLVAMGHIELLTGQSQDARQAFETAISLSKGKSIPVLNAIGFANIKAPAGDANYAIDKLKQATAIKGLKDADVYINLGDAYMKIQDGGDAQTAYQSAADMDTKSPIPSFKLGKLYETQGHSQEEIFVSDYDDAIGKDPTFAPVYYDLYAYYYLWDIDKSRDYLDKYIANADPDPADCYYYASILFASKLFQQSIDKSNQCIADGGTTPYPNLFGLKAYCYFALGDSVNAKASFEQYFAKQLPSKIGPTDYSTYAKILLGIPGNDSLASVYIDKAIALDSLPDDKINEAKTLITYYTAKGDMNGVANGYKKIIAVRTPPFNGDYQSAGFYYYKALNFPAAAAIFDSAVQYFPNDLYDNYMLGKSLSYVDSTMKDGLAKPAFDKVIQVGAADSVTNKAQLIGAYQYMVEYYVNIKKDKDTALMYCDKILALDPTNAETIKNREIISKLKFKSSGSK